MLLVPKVELGKTHLRGANCHLFHEVLFVAADNASLLRRSDDASECGNALLPPLLCQSKVISLEPVGAVVVAVPCGRSSCSGAEGATRDALSQRTVFLRAWWAVAAQC